MNSENLWGVLPQAEAIETPASILRTQASALGRLTRGLLDGKVVTGQTGRSEFEHEFRIIAPPLGNYSVTILNVTHRVDMYPAFVNSASETGWTSGQQVTSNEELKPLLSTIFQSSYIQKVIAALLAQIRDLQASPAPKEP